MTAEQQSLLREAVDWRLLSLLFECPSPGWAEQIAGLAATSENASLREAAAATSEASEGLYHSIFGPGGPVAPREASYHDNVQLGGLLSELAAHYDAFGFQPKSLEALDHVSVEAGFIGYLTLKEAYAFSSGNTEHARVTAEARRHFLAEHLATIAASLTTTLNQSGVRYLALAGKMLAELSGPPPARCTRSAATPVFGSSEFISTDSLFDCAS